MIKKRKEKKSKNILEVSYDDGENNYPSYRPDECYNKLNGCIYCKTHLFITSSHDLESQLQDHYNEQLD